MTSNWTPELEAKVALLWMKHSDSVISAILLSEDKVHFSRNAIIGKRHRMGGASAVPRQREPKPDQPRRDRRRDGVGSAVQHINRVRSPRPPRLPVETVKLRCVEIMPRHLSLMDLEPGDCRYPYGGDKDGEPITFCGHPQIADQSYCAPHFHLCRGLGTQSERAATKGIAA